MSDVLTSETPRDRVRLITMNRPDQLNAMNAELCEALHRELERNADHERVQKLRALGYVE